MGNMKQEHYKQIALDFSGGKFENTYPYLAGDICFDMVGEKLLNGKEQVMAFCDRIAEYFTTVTTKFTLNNVIAEGNCVAINGTAEFYVEKEGRTNFISSCDVYKFDEGMLKEITSYCISAKKEQAGSQSSK